MEFKDNLTRIQGDSGYKKLIKMLFYCQKLEEWQLQNAMSYVRSLNKFNSIGLIVLSGTSTFSTEEKTRILFAGKGKCATCHFIPLFNGQSYIYKNRASNGNSSNQNGKIIDQDLGRLLNTKWHNETC
jgi:cytochrome c peroxidase